MAILGSGQVIRKVHDKLVVCTLSTKHSIVVHYEMGESRTLNKQLMALKSRPPLSYSSTYRARENIYAATSQHIQLRTEIRQNN